MSHSIHGTLEFLVARLVEHQLEYFVNFGFLEHCDLGLKLFIFVSLSSWNAVFQ